MEVCFRVPRGIAFDLLKFILYTELLSKGQDGCLRPDQKAQDISVKGSLILFVQ